MDLLAYAQKLASQGQPEYQAYAQTLTSISQPAQKNEQSNNKNKTSLLVGGAIILAVVSALGIGYLMGKKKKGQELED